MSADATHHLTTVMDAAGSQVAASPQVDRLIAALMDHANSAGVRLNVIERKGVRFFSLDKSDRENGAAYPKQADLKNICAVNIMYSWRPPSVDVYVHPRTGRVIVSGRQGLPTSLEGVQYGSP